MAHRLETYSYMDPSAAHEKGMRYKLKGAFRVVIDREPGGTALPRYRVQAWYIDSSNKES